MAVIAQQQSDIKVSGVGSVMTARVEDAGMAMIMDLLAKTYTFPMMAAVREPIQNAIDGARRAGLSFSEGVLVIMPTPENPEFSVVDKGAGMPRSFMESTYLSFGSSTKSKDNGAAGGFGVGRWADYGYIGEGTITTCNAEDMIARTYFKYKGEDGLPKVKLAAEAPATETGTKVSFPLKDTDVDECLRAIAWLKAVMQLTMGDSFSVNAPACLPDIFPKFGGTVLELGTVDAGLAGVRLYPMQGKELQYSRAGLAVGSLVVLTNQEAGVGGLPFHIKNLTGGVSSVMWQGMVIEIPMSYNVPFMPSREELMYTDEVTALFRRIDLAAEKAIVAKAAELFNTPGIVSKAQLSELLGNSEEWHWFAHAARQTFNVPLYEPLKMATGGVAWRGQLTIGTVPELAPVSMRCESGDGVLREAFVHGGRVSVGDGRGGHLQLNFSANKPICLVANDVKSGGMQRFRAWLGSGAAKACKHLFLTAGTPEENLAAAEALNVQFDGFLPILKVSTMPEVARVVVGEKVVRASRKASLTFFDMGKDKQDTALMGFTSPVAEELCVWVEKDGGQLAGFNDTVQVRDFFDRWDGSLKSAFEATKLSRLYLLTPKQARELAELKDELGAIDAAICDGEEVDQETLDAKAAVTKWIPFEEWMMRALELPIVAKVLEGRYVREVTPSWDLNRLVTALAQKPRLGVSGTKFDKEFMPFIDMMTATNKVLPDQDSARNAVHHMCNGLSQLSDMLESKVDDPIERQELVQTLDKLKTAGRMNYREAYEHLSKQFPLLRMMNRAWEDASAVDDLVAAMVAVYR